MTRTVNIELTENWKDIADSTQYSTCTIQVIENQSAEVHVDERTIAERDAADDKRGISYKPLERAQFSDWDGTIRARAPFGTKKTTIAVILS